VPRGIVFEIAVVWGHVETMKHHGRLPLPRE
jgi:hypothetical protein